VRIEEFPHPPTASKSRQARENKQACGFSTAVVDAAVSQPLVVVVVFGTWPRLFPIALGKKRRRRSHDSCSPEISSDDCCDEHRYREQSGGRETIEL
jgi:hypothetical protein